MTAIISSLAPVETTINAVTTTLATESVGLSADIIQMKHHHSGNMSPTAVLIPGASPRVQLSMPFDLAYSVVGLGVVKATALNLWLTKFEDFIRVAPATTSHQKFSLAASAVASMQITGFSVNVDGILMATVEVIYLSADGKTHPVVITDNVAEVAFSGSPVLHTLGPARINGTLYSGVTATNGTIAGNMVVQRTDGDLYPRVAARPQIAPTIYIGHADPRTLLAALTLPGSPVSSTTEVFFKRYDPTTGITSLSNGIKIALTDGYLEPTGFDASQGAVASMGVTAHAIATDGQTNPLTVTTGVTVPDSA